MATYYIHKITPMATFTAETYVMSQQSLLSYAITVHHLRAVHHTDVSLRHQDGADKVFTSSSRSTIRLQWNVFRKRCADTQMLLSVCVSGIQYDVCKQALKVPQVVLFYCNL